MKQSQFLCLGGMIYLAPHLTETVGTIVGLVLIVCAFVALVNKV